MRRPANDVAGRAAHDGTLDRVRDVLAVGGGDQRRLRREGRSQTCRHEEVRVDDLRIEASRRAARVAKQLHVPAAAPNSPVHHGPLELMAAREKLVLEGGDEHAEIRVVGPGIHL